MFSRIQYGISGKIPPPKMVISMNSRPIVYVLKIVMAN
jgi:hypothetical protein